MKIIHLIILSCLLPVRMVFAQHPNLEDSLVRAPAQHPNLEDSLVRVPAQEQKWPGVDETVVERYAEEHGRKARDPFINTDQGDLLLFMFLLAGSTAGFAAGYYWRVLMENKPKP